MSEMFILFQTCLFWMQCTSTWCILTCSRKCWFFAQVPWWWPRIHSHREGCQLEWTGTLSTWCEGSHRSKKVAGCTELFECLIDMDVDIGSISLEWWGELATKILKLIWHVHPCVAGVMMHGLVVKFFSSIFSKIVLLCLAGNMHVVAVTTFIVMVSCLYAVLSVMFVCFTFGISEWAESRFRNIKPCWSSGCTWYLECAFGNIVDGLR